MTVFNKRYCTSFIVAAEAVNIVAELAQDVARSTLQQHALALLIMSISASLVEFNRSLPPVGCPLLISSFHEIPLGGPDQSPTALTIVSKKQLCFLLRWLRLYYLVLHEVVPIMYEWRHAIQLLNSLSFWAP